MRTKPCVVIILSAIMLLSCSQKRKRADSLVESDSASFSMKEILETYYIADNVILESPILPADFDPDSIDSYDFVEDYEGKMYQATLINTQKPPIFKEGIYDDITDGKRKFFIYEDSQYKRNLIYIGTLLSSEQMIAAGFNSSQAHSDAAMAMRKTTLETPKNKLRDNTTKYNSNTQNNEQVPLKAFTSLEEDSLLKYINSIQ